MAQLCRITRRDGTSYWVGTQGEAKQEARQIGGKWEVVEVPIDKRGQLAFINQMQEQINGLLQRQDDDTEPLAAAAVPTPPPPPAPAPVDLTADKIMETIMDAEAPEAARYVHVSVCRLGELGEQGYEHIRAVASQPKKVGQGLGPAFYRGSAILNQIAAFEQ